FSWRRRSHPHPLFPYTTLFRSAVRTADAAEFFVRATDARPCDVAVGTIVRAADASSICVPIGAKFCDVGVSTVNSGVRRQRAVRSLAGSATRDRWIGAGDSTSG